ncbi:MULTISPECIES: hypothetical protein [unclassified Brevundimonas]|uniref:hypothetical protein n=1 Tax=unclassified Brevundimonas TaxID=2622653 RepID=UPI0025BA0364|nr:MULTISPECIES: hypothetical protein [unclassified Brevundimonas]
MNRFAAGVREVPRTDERRVADDQIVSGTIRLELRKGEIEGVRRIGGQLASFRPRLNAPCHGESAVRGVFAMDIDRNNSIVEESALPQRHVLSAPLLLLTGTP